MIRKIGLAAIALLIILDPLRADLILSQKEITQVLRHGPWPPEAKPDPSNRVSGNTAAITLGRELFTDPILSRGGTMSCATCHQPDRDFTDGLARAQGQELLDRNTPALWNLRGKRWFGWSGDSDNLWAQNITPLFNPLEMNHTPDTLHAALLKSRYWPNYSEIFEATHSDPPIETTVNIAKSLAAYIETLTTQKTSFDVFRDALESGRFEAAAQYPEAAQRGVQIFLGQGNCAFCHSGPAFTNNEFHDAGVPYFLGRGRVDEGRHAGLRELKSSPYTLDGEFNDDSKKSGAWAVRNVRFHHRNFGKFRVPTLRRAVKTPPYMHNGSLSSLSKVIQHYNHIDLDRLHADGENILAPMGLSSKEAADLEAFLETLSDD